MAMARSYEGLHTPRTFHDLMRLLQFLTAIISLALFSRYIHQLRHHRLRTRGSPGAVEGILSVAVLYTLVSLLLRALLRNRVVSPLLRRLQMALDLLFMALFITVAALTRPNGGQTGFCSRPLKTSGRPVPAEKWCHLRTGVFTLAVLSTLLHFLTALFHEIQEKRANHFVHDPRTGLVNEGGHEMNNNVRV
ncbi:MAG: hypothetical protein Q9169_005438 [Polycauliona sp. 2 TL-2023]